MAPETKFEREVQHQQLPASQIISPSACTIIVHCGSSSRASESRVVTKQDLDVSSKLNLDSQWGRNEDSSISHTPERHVPVPNDNIEIDSAPLSIQLEDPILGELSVVVVGHWCVAGFSYNAT